VRRNPSSGQLNVGSGVDEYWSNGTATYLSTFWKETPPQLYLGTTMRNENSTCHHASSTCDHVSGTVPYRSPNCEERGDTRSAYVNVALKSVLAGSLSGLVSTALFHPFDVLRTKMQTSTSLMSSKASATVLTTASRDSAMTPGNRLAGPWSIFTYTMKNGGVRALYTGIKPVLIAQAGYKATVFTVNNLAINMLVEWKTQEQYKVGIFQPYELSSFDTFLCGAIGGAVNAAALVAPVEFVRNQQISHHSRISSVKGMTSITFTSSMKGPMDILKSTVRIHGIQRLWHGTGVTVLRDSLGCGAFFALFEMSKERIAPTFGGRESSGTILASGALAGLGYWAFALPLDTLKTLVQTGAANSAREIILSSVERDGLLRTVQGVFRGWQLAFGRGAPAAAVTLTVYTAAYKFCGCFC